MIENTAIVPVAALLVNAATAAKLCGGISLRTWWALHSAGMTPLPVRLGRRTLWRADELADWCKAGCLARDRWQWSKRVQP